MIGESDTPIHSHEAHTGSIGNGSADAIANILLSITMEMTKQFNGGGLPDACTSSKLLH